MERCFVMQPFDGAAFDSRYDDVYDPAIRDAGLEPYRVDKDPSATILINDIEEGIRTARVCLADITLDNPNVWFELGFAIASQKEVILVCSTGRTTKFPFDVQHRAIITYATDAPRNFAELRTKITDRITAALQKASVMSAVSHASPVQKVDGLDQHEIIVLAALGESIEATDGTATIHEIRRDMERYGFTRFATMLGLKSLQTRDFVVERECEDQDGHQWFVYALTPRGWAWIYNNKDQFVLKRTDTPDLKRTGAFDPEIPF